MTVFLIKKLGGFDSFWAEPCVLLSHVKYQNGEDFLLNKQWKQQRADYYFNIQAVKLKLLEEERLHLDLQRSTSSKKPGHWFTLKRPSRTRLSLGKLKYQGGSAILPT